MFYDKYIKHIRSLLKNIKNMGGFSNILRKLNTSLMHKLSKFFKTYHPGGSAVDFKKAQEFVAALKWMITVILIVIILNYFL